MSKSDNLRARVLNAFQLLQYSILMLFDALFAEVLLLLLLDGSVVVTSSLILRLGPILYLPQTTDLMLRSVLRKESCWLCLRLAR